MKRWLSLLLAAVLTLTVLTACGEESVEETKGEDAMKLRIRATTEQTNLDPLAARANGGDTLTYHLFENLMRWEDDGTGHAVLGYGAAESYTVSEDVDGSVTYTFTIREDAEWSDGKDVTAYHFLDGWQRLFEMEEPPAELSELYMVDGYEQARQEKNGGLLIGVTAPNRDTLVIRLTSRCAYFLDEYCAGTLTMPVRQDLIKEYGAIWGKTAKTVVGNGPYRIKAMESGQVIMVRNEKYWGRKKLHGPEELIFTWKVSAVSDYNELLAGRIDFLAGLPAAEVKEMAAAGTLEPEPLAATYALLMNSRLAPLDDPFVRGAFRILVDQKKMAEDLGITLETPATGFVPTGIANRDDTWVEANRPTEENAEQEGEEAVPEYWDYRAVGDRSTLAGELPAGDTLESQARVMLSQAGYPNGTGFPAVEYLYVDTPQNAAVAQWLQERFRSVLNVEITLKAVTEAEARTLLLSGEFSMAAFRFNAAYDDALAFLQRWRSDKDAPSGNLVGFGSRAYDLLLSVVSASDNSAREACLHDAEQLLLESGEIVPLFYYNTTAQLGEGLTGLCRHDGQNVWLFGGVSRIVAEEEPEAAKS